MAIRFALARHRHCAPLARVLTMPCMDEPANDSAILSRDGLLRRALLHFSEHGLAAAALARGQALAARRAGDAVGFHEWLGICRLLDRRMADQVKRRR